MDSHRKHMMNTPATASSEPRIASLFTSLFFTAYASGTLYKGPKDVRVTHRLMLI